jgi:FeS assembly SUF system regulator
MLRLSKMSDYGIVILAAMAEADSASHTALSLADRTHVPRPTVSKLLKALAGTNLVRSVRGRNGGYFLSRPPAEISVTEIIEAIEGPMAITECGLDGGSCELEAHCHTRPHWRQINHAIRDALQGVTLQQLAASSTHMLTYWPKRDAKVVQVAGTVGGR